MLLQFKHTNWPCSVNSQAVTSLPNLYFCFVSFLKCTPNRFAFALVAKIDFAHFIRRWTAKEKLQLKVDGCEGINGNEFNSKSFTFLFNYISFILQLNQCWVQRITLSASVYGICRFIPRRIHYWFYSCSYGKWTTNGKIKFAFSFCSPTSQCVSSSLHWHCRSVLFGMIDCIDKHKHME